MGPAKAEVHPKKHGVGSNNALTVFGDPLARVLDNDKTSDHFSPVTDVARDVGQRVNDVRDGPTEGSS